MTHKAQLWLDAMSGRFHELPTERQEEVIEWAGGGGPGADHARYLTTKGIEE